MTGAVKKSSERKKLDLEILKQRISELKIKYPVPDTKESTNSPFVTQLELDKCVEFIEGNFNKSGVYLEDLLGRLETLINIYERQIEYSFNYHKKYL